MRRTLSISLAVIVASVAAPAFGEKSSPIYNIDSFPNYPELTINKLTKYTEWSEETGLTPGMFAPHCKVHGTIGKHNNFELLLPCDFNRSMQHID